MTVNTATPGRHRRRRAAQLTDLQGLLAAGLATAAPKKASGPARW